MLVEDEHTFRCAKGCGELLSAAGLAALIKPGDLRLEDEPPRWNALTPPPSCPSCGRTMRLLLLERREVFRCPSHGIWFDRGGRAAFDRVHADALARTLELAAWQRAMAADVDGVVRGDRAVVEGLLRRVAALEETVRLLRAQAATRGWDVDPGR
jgi:predicted RNA-binding Zn-ribbon protein involved in translation (DUF1610 family)